MSRRIAYVFFIAACASFAAPAFADRECFESTCRMPEVTEPPEAPADAGETAVVDVVPPATERRAPAQPSPQTIVDQLARPALKASPHRAVEQAPVRAVRQIARQAPRQPDVANEPVEPVNRQYAGSPVYAAQSQPSQPGAGVVVVVPGFQYGDDGVAMMQGRQDSSWELCQSDRRGNGRCGPYNYQPYGAHGYRPLGSYRQHRVAPAYVYVPDAKIVPLDAAD